MSERIIIKSEKVQRWQQGRVVCYIRNMIRKKYGPNKTFYNNFEIEKFINTFLKDLLHKNVNPKIEVEVIEGSQVGQITVIVKSDVITHRVFYPPRNEE